MFSTDQYSMFKWWKWHEIINYIQAIVENILRWKTLLLVLILVTYDHGLGRHEMTIYSHFLLFLFVWWKNNSSGALPAGAKEMLLPGHHLTWWKGKLCFTKPSNRFICYLIFDYLGKPAVIFNSFKWTRNVPGSQSEKHAFGDQWWFWTFLRNAFCFTKPIWLSSRHLQNQVLRKFTMFYPTFLRRYSHNPPSPAGPAQRV